MSRLVSVAGNQSMQGLAGLSRSSAARVSGDDDQAGRHSRRRSGRGRRQRSGSGAIGSRLFAGELRRHAVTAGRRCGFARKYLPINTVTSAGESARRFQLASVSTISVGAVVLIASKLDCQRKSIRRGSVHGSVLDSSIALKRSELLVHSTRPLLHGSTSGAMKNLTHVLLNLNDRCFRTAECSIESSTSVGVPIAVARERRDRASSVVVAFQPGRNGRTARAGSSAAAASISVWTTTAR